MNLADDRNGVICAGRLYADLIFTGMNRFPELGAEIFAEELGVHTGGGAFITAAYLASLGRPTHLMATFPAAPFGPLLETEIAACQVGTDLCAPAAANDDPQLTAAIVMGEDRAFLTRRAGSAIPQHHEHTLDVPGVRHLHISELSTLVEHPGLIAAARSAGMTISLDCGWDDELLKADVSALIAQVDVFIPNAAEAEALQDAGMRWPVAPVTVVKRGAKGADAWNGGDHFSVPAEPAAVVDATGAGDAFNGGFIDSWLAGGTVRDCLVAGCRLGAIAVTQRGGVSALSQASSQDVAGTGR